MRERQVTQEYYHDPTVIVAAAFLGESLLMTREMLLECQYTFYRQLDLLSFEQFMMAIVWDKWEEMI